MRISFRTASRMLLILPLLCLGLAAQDETPTAVTTQNRSGELPYSASIGSPVEHVDVMSGNLTVNIQPSHVPGRGLDYNFSLLYDARWLVAATRGGPTNTTQLWNAERRLYVPDNGFGWQSNQPSLTYVSHVGDENNGSSCTLNQSGPQAAFHRVYNTQNFIFSDSTGAKHPLILNKEDGSACVPSYMVINAKGPDEAGEGLWADNSPFGSGAPQVYLADGTLLVPGGCTLSIQDGYLCPYSYAQDVHGNQVHFGPGGADSVGRVNLTQTSAAGQTIYTVHDAAGNPRNYTVNYAPFQVATTFNAIGPYGPITEFSAQRNAITSITLPDTTAYSFVYDNFGGLTQLTLPTGAVINYQWSTFDTGENMMRYVSRRWVTVNGITSVWQFSRAFTANNKVIVTVTDPNNNQSVYTSGDTGSVVGNVKIYNGAATGTPLREYQVDYLQDVTTSSPILPARITTILDNGMQSKKEFDYDSFNYSHYDCINPVDCQQNGPVLNQLPETRGNVVSIREYAYGQGAPGALIRTTSNKYLADLTDNSATGPQYATRNIVSKIIRQTITDAQSGAVASDTAYQYDNGTTTGPFLGDATQVQHWRNTDNTWLPTTYQYNSYGSITAITDPKLHTTTWDYGDLWAPSLGNCLPTANSSVYPSLVKNAKQQRLQLTHSPCTGQVQAHQNENDLVNGLPGTLHTYDLLNRPLTVSDVGGGQVSTDYPDPVTVHQSTRITSLLSTSATTLHDGLGRDIQTQTVVPDANNQSTTAKVDSGYDLAGNKISVSNPYVTTSDATYGVTHTVYDGLGRPTQVQPTDGPALNATSCPLGNACTSYSGNSTTVTDQAGKVRRSITDALGRLIEVDEPGENFSGTASSGSVSIAGSLASHTTSGTAAVAASGTVSIWSADGSGTDLHIDDPNETCPPLPQTCPQIYDSGWARVTVNGIASQVTYGRFDTWTGLATNLVTAINASGANVYVTASASGTTITITAKTAGAAGNSITLSATSATNDAADFGGPSFGGTASGAHLTSGADAVNPVTVWDQGNVTVSLGSSYSVSVPYSQGTNSSASQVATALATALNVAGSPVTANASATSLNINYKNVGYAGNMAVTATSASTQTQWTFPANSFSGSGALANGADASGPSLDHNYYVTLYQYDVLGNLICVEQHGNSPAGPHADGTTAGTGCNDPASGDANSTWRVRRFTYNSLSQLLTAKNPESGTISYVYDADGNLQQKTSPAPNQPVGSNLTQTISYCYDELHRVTGKAYSAQNCTADNGNKLPPGTAVVSYTYDVGTNAAGKLTHVDDQAGTVDYTYDPVGRVSTETRVISGISKTISYDYNLDGSVQKLHYPSGAAITYTPGVGGRLLSAIDSVNNINYATAATYQADGQMTGFISGSGSGAITNIFTYNKRLQPVDMTAQLSPTNKVFSITYDFHFGNGNNGNVFGILNNRDHARDQAFAYDPLNRVTSAWNMGTDCNRRTANNLLAYWGNTYAYDPWGNLTNKTKITTACAGENLSITVGANNRISSAGYGYDVAGNMTGDGTEHVNLTYDPENRISGPAGYAYTYDADGNRVIKATTPPPGTQPTGTIYWYMTPGIVGESDLSGAMKSEYVFFNGERVARRDNPGSPSATVAYYFSDHLKTASVITDSAGVIKADSDYYPWGGELQFTANDSNRYKFTGKERDTETNLDYFGARYYSNGLGRFITPDWSSTPTPVPYVALSDPQTLNQYSYVGNHPTSFYDVDGHCYQWLQHLCNLGQRIRNKVTGYGFRTDAQAEQAVHDANTFLRAHNVSPEQRERMSDKQALAVADAIKHHKSSVISDGVKFILNAVPVVAGALPGANPDWGRNRLIKELHDRGFVYEGPTNSGDGLMYKNPTTGEEVRIMPSPSRTPFRNEPSAKFENDYYYRYRSGPDQPWGPHTTLPDK